MLTRSVEPVLDTYQSVVSAFCEFLTVAVHTILYERNIYPQTSFLSVRKYNYPVRQNRHPKVCQWIEDAASAVEVELLKGTVSQTSLVIYSPFSIPLERFIFSTANFPNIPTSEINTQFEDIPLELPISTTNDLTPTSSPQTHPQAAPYPYLDPPTGSAISSQSSPPRTPPINAVPLSISAPLIDLHSQFRAYFARLSTSTSTLSPLPPNCTFSLAIELRAKPQGEAPIGWPQPWIAAEPGLQRKADAPKVGQVTGNFAESGSREGGTTRNTTGLDNTEGGYKTQKGKYLGGVRTTPIRHVEAGAFVMEMWVEEGKDKADELLRAMELRAKEESMKAPQTKDK